MEFTIPTSVRNIGFGALALLATIPLIYAEGSQLCGRESGGGGGGSRGGGGVRAGGGESRSASVERSPVFVNRSNHGSIRHLDTNVYQRPATAIPNFTARQGQVTTAPAFSTQKRVLSHQDLDADVYVPRNSNNFAFGARRHGLRPGYARLLVNNQPYYYDDGIYYQQYGDVSQDNEGAQDADYQEVYPPVGADIATLPDGAVEIDAANATYYYAAGAFYVQQDGGYVIVASPIGVVVPELPPGAVAVTYGNGVAYQFNGTCYQPVFVDGVTQYVTVQPNPQACRDDGLGKASVEI